MKVFVPFTDDLMDHPDFAEMLVPYQPGKKLLSQMEVVADQSRSSTRISPADSSSSEALPALSSNTYLAGPLLG